MPIFKKKVTANDDGFLDPNTKKVHPDDDESSKKQKALGDNEIRRRKTIAKIYKDATLTPEEKNDQIQSLLKESEKVTDPPPSSTTTQQQQGSKQVDDEDDDDIGRRKKIGSIFKDSGLTPKEKLDRISGMLTTATEKGNEKVQEEEGTEEGAQIAQRRTIQDVYKDNQLSSQEKHERIQAVMKGEGEGEGEVEVVMKGDEVDIVVNEVDNDGDSSYRSGSDSRSGSHSRSHSSRSRHSSRRSSDYSGSGSYSRSRSTHSSDDHSSSRGSRSRQEPRGSTGRSGQESQPEQAMARASGVTHQIPEGTKEEDGSDKDDVVDEEEEGNPRRRMICCFVFTVILLAAIAGPLLYKYWDDLTGKKSATAVPLVAPTEAPTVIPEPTASPTELVLLYDPPTDAQCFAIARGNDIVGQADLDNTSFDIEIDVAVSNDNLDYEALVATLEERMQERIAPSLAGCPEESRRLTGLQLQLRGIRILNEKRYVIRNAKVNAQLDTGRTCNVQEPCFSVFTRLTLFLAGPEDTSVLTSRINDLFNQDLTLEKMGLSDSFRGLTFVGVTATSPTNAPTLAPSMMPSPNPSASSSPTVVASFAPTAAPTTTGTQTPNEDPSSIRRPFIESALETIGPLEELNQHAVDWLIQDDTWLPDDTSDASVWIQRYVIYILFEETCGHEWEERDGWLGATSICDGWFGVSCDGDGSEATGLQLGGLCRAQ
jgi:hypothetical protein